MIAGHDTDAARSKGRPRSIAAGEAITEATLDLIAEFGSIEPLSIEAIATRAGVSKTTIYRRWPNKEALIMAALGKLKGEFPELVGDSVREDLLTIARTIGKSGDTREGKVLPCLLLELKRNPELARLYEEAMRSRRDSIKAVFQRGISTGELRPDIDVDTVGTMFTTPLTMVMIYGGYPDVSRQGLSERVVDTLLQGISA